jgi:hypothetical protein
VTKCDQLVRNKTLKLHAAIDSRVLMGRLMRSTPWSRFSRTFFCVIEKKMMPAHQKKWADFRVG